MRPKEMPNTYVARTLLQFRWAWAVCVFATAATAASLPAPMELGEALRQSLEEPQQYLVKVPALLNSDYARQDTRWRCEILMRRMLAGIVLADQAVVDQAIADLESLAQQENVPVARAYALFRKAKIQSSSGKFAQAMQYVTAGVSITNALGDSALMGLGQSNLCNLHYRMKEYQTALSYCQKARALLAAGHAEYFLAANDGTTANVLEALGRDDDALEASQRARQGNLKLRLYSTAVSLNDNISEIYLRRGQPEKALANSQAALQLELAEGRTTFAVSSRQNIASALSAMGRQHEALDYIADAISEAKRINFTHSLADSYTQQFLNATAIKNFPLALQAAENAIEATKEGAAEQSRIAVAEMSARFQSVEQALEIKRLDQVRLERELELSRAREQNHAQLVLLARQKFLLWLTLVSIVALALISSLLLMFWRTSRRHAAAMQTLADTDGLTGVLNRRAFIERAQGAIARARAEAGKACLCIVDADHFKVVNDTYGHQSGDLALRLITQFMSSNLPIGAIVGRLGGEEFALLLPASDSATTIALAEIIRADVFNAQAAPMPLPFPIAVSIGVAELGENDNQERWFAKADKALYDAKARGRNCVFLYQDGP
jgi:diguanylate cyclase (GGDEF)-like protein